MTDVAVEIVSPRDTEEPGLVPVMVKLANIGDVPALVARLDVKITDGGYLSDYVQNIAVGVGAQQVLTFGPWSYSGGTETCTAWITCPQDENHHNDTDVVIVNRLSGLSEGARTDVSRSPGGLGASIAHTTSVVSHAGPLNVTVFDITGRVVLDSRLGAAQAGKSLLDLGGLRSGVYLVRLEDGRSATTQKLVIQR